MRYYEDVQKIALVLTVLLVLALARELYVQHEHQTDSHDDADKATVCQDVGTNYEKDYTVIMPYYGSDSDHSCIVYENDTRQMYFACEGKNECMVPLCDNGKPVFYEKETDMDSDEMRKIVKKAAEYAGKE